MIRRRKNPIEIKRWEWNRERRRNARRDELEFANIKGFWKGLFEGFNLHCEGREKFEILNLGERFFRKRGNELNNFEFHGERTRNTSNKIERF